MRPQPRAPIPILVGGLSAVALRRAARHDGWIGDLCTIDDAIATAARLRALRERNGRADDPFSVTVALTDAVSTDDFVRAAAGGVTRVMTMPWIYYHGFTADLDQKIDGLRRFRDDVMEPVAASLRDRGPITTTVGTGRTRAW